MAKIILSDIDGTFLKKDKTVHELHAAAVKDLIAQGIKFVLVSARMPEAMYPITDGIKIPRQPIISYSGGLVLTESEEILYDKKMPLEDTANILAAMESTWQDISINYYAGRKWYVRQIDERIQHEINITQAAAEVLPFEKLLDKNISANKIMIICPPPICEEMETKLGAQFQNLNVVRSAPYLLEIMDKTVSKAVGIKVLLNHYGFSVNDAIAFGDNYNDIEMLQYIPQSVVMGNAPEKVLKIASAVTDTSEDAGIYTYLKKINLLKNC